MRLLEKKPAATCTTENSRLGEEQHRRENGAPPAASADVVQQECVKAIAIAMATTPLCHSPSAVFFFSSLLVYCTSRSSSHASLSVSLCVSPSLQRNKATNKISFYFDKDTKDKSSGEMLALLLLFRFALGSELISSYPQFINTPLIPQSKKLFFFFFIISPF
jgi:hypothetical protein